MDINQQSILGTFLPNVYVTKITLNDDKVSISLMIKENIEDDEELSYLSNDLLKEFIRISIIQSIDEKTTEALADNFLIEKNRFDPTISKTFLNLIKTKNSKITYDEDGNREIHYDYVFILNTVELEHLSYFVFCEINEEAIRKKFKLKSSVRLDFSPNKITNEIVLEKGRISEESYIYLLPDGSLWAGAVKERSTNEYFTVEPEPRRLEKNIINNYKVQDFRSRNIKSVSKTSVLIDNILMEEGEDIINSSFNRTLLKNTYKINSSIFDIYHSYNSDNSVTINFKIDFSKLLKENSPFPSLVNENSTYEDLNDGIIANTEIINVKLFRRQVKTSINKFNNKPIDIGEPEYIIFSGIPEEINLGQPNKFIKQYSITDLDIQEKTSGEYQYYISTEFKDGIISFLRDKLNLLIENYSYLKNYYNSCVLIENYDKDTDSFTSEFSINYKIEDVANLVNIYISTLAQIYNLNQSETDRLQKNLSLFVSPSFGNPKGILYFVSLYENLINKLSQYVSINNNNFLSNLKSFSSVKEKISVKKEFNYVVNAEILNRVNVEYLPIVNGAITLEAFRDRIKNEITKFNLDNTNIYSNQYSTCYLSPSKIYVENKQYDVISEKNEEEFSTIRSEIQCLNSDRTFSRKISDSSKIDEKIRNFDNIKNLLSNQGVVFEYIRISGSSIQLEDLDYNQINLTQAETQNISRTIDSKIYDASQDIEQIYNPYYVPKIVEKQGTPNQLIKFNDLALEQKNINSAKNLFNYGLLVQIEYNDAGQWKLLTDSELDKNIKEPGIKTINCRLKKYAYSNNKIIEQKNIKFTYNEYFSINLNSEVIDNFINTAVPIISLPQTKLGNRTTEFEIEEVYPKIKYFDPKDGTLDDKEIIIKGSNFKKGLEVYIYKDKVNKNNIVFKASTKTKNPEISLINNEEIRVKINKIDNYKNIKTQPGKIFNTELVEQKLIDAVIVIKNLKNDFAEYKDFKLSSEKPIKNIKQNIKELIKKPVTHFDNKDKIQSIMDIGLGIKKNNKEEAFDRTSIDEILDNNKPIGPKDKIKDKIKEKLKDLPIATTKEAKQDLMPKPTSVEINVKNISSNSKTINLIKNDNINTAIEDINNKTTLKQQKPIVEQKIDIKPQPKVTNIKQTVSKNKIKATKTR